MNPLKDLPDIPSLPLITEKVHIIGERKHYPECPECGHDKRHDKYGCEYEYGDRIFSAPGNPDWQLEMAAGPCGCMARNDEVSISDQCAGADCEHCPCDGGRFPLDLALPRSARCWCECHEPDMDDDEVSESGREL